MKTPGTVPNSRIEREVERELEQRHRNDEAKTGLSSDDDFRIKDARSSSRSSDLHRSRDRS